MRVEETSLQETQREEGSHTIKEYVKDKVKGGLKSRYKEELSALRGEKKKAENAQMIEGIIGLYKVTALGKLEKYSEVDLNMGRKFMPSSKGNMVLTRSKDKKIVSITNFDREDKNENYFKFLAWTNKLKPFPKSGHDFSILESGINKYYSAIKDSFDELVELSLVGGSKFVQLIYYEAKQRDLKEQQEYE